MLIDFHTHLDAYKKEELSAQLASFKGLLISASMNEQSYLQNCRIAAELGSKEARIIPTFGIHPNCAEEGAELLEDKESVKRFESYLQDCPLIGEIGMDFCWSKASRKSQEKVFRWFLDYSQKSGKYCVIHTKDAEKEIADILEDYPAARPVIHWYDGPEDIFRGFIKKGYPQTFGVESIRSEHIQKLLRLTPPQLLLAETDNPESEIWLGGKRKDLGLIEKVYQDLAGLLGISQVKLENQIEENVKKICAPLLEGA